MEALAFRPASKPYFANRLYSLGKISSPTALYRGTAPEAAEKLVSATFCYSCHSLRTSVRGESAFSTFSAASLAPASLARNESGAYCIAPQRKPSPAGIRALTTRRVNSGDMGDLGRMLVLLGGLLLVLGLVLILAGKVNLPIGRMPGDIVVRGKNTTFYFPLMTSIVLSVLLSLVLWMVNRMRR